MVLLEAEGKVRGSHLVDHGGDALVLGRQGHVCSFLGEIVVLAMAAHDYVVVLSFDLTAVLSQLVGKSFLLVLRRFAIKTLRLFRVKVFRTLISKLGLLLEHVLMTLTTLLFIVSQVKQIHFRSVLIHARISI